MSLTKMALLVGMAGLLASCAGLDNYPQDSPHYRYSSGWVLQLNRTLEIAPDEASVRLQRGRVVPRNSVQEYDPFCIVELDTVRAEVQILQPGRFEVWRVRRSMSFITVAASPRVRAAYVDDDGDPSFLYYITEFRLRDPAQPNLRAMTCAWNQMAPANRALMRHLTLDEIQGALGDWISLIPPKETI
jgi:hypothetical protein